MASVWVQWVRRVVSDAVAATQLEIHAVFLALLVLAVVSAPRAAVYLSPPNSLHSHLAAIIHKMGLVYLTVAAGRWMIARMTHGYLQALVSPL